MSKKNLHFSENRLPCTRTWTPPMYHQGKENYIDFYAVDPSTGCMKRKKIMLDRLHKKGVRNAYAKQVIEELTQKLVRGWNPFVEIRANEQFTSWEEVCARYSQYCVKMNNDHSFREETLRDYLSRIKILGDWVKSSPFKVFYPYQLDDVVLAKFMDYVLIERNCSAQTYNNYLAWLHTFCGWMLQRRYIHDDPTEGMRPIKRNASKNRTVIPDSELVKIRQYCEKHNPHFLLASYILHYMFVRPHEMSMLRIRDFNIQKKTLLLYGSQTKNGNNAVLTLPDNITRLMVELDIFSYPGSYYLFSTCFRPGEEWRDSKQFRDYWIRHIRKALKLPAEYKFYSLKDTGITNMLRSNTDPISVRDQARHSSLLITNTYTPLDIKEANPLILNYKGVF